MPLLELRAPNIDSIPLARIRSAFVPPVGSILELELDELVLRGFSEEDRELLHARAVWAWVVLEVRFPIKVSSKGCARRVVVHLEPLLFRPDR